MELLGRTRRSPVSFGARPIEPCDWTMRHYTLGPERVTFIALLLDPTRGLQCAQGAKARPKLSFGFKLK
jgi:hypothetical protein